jgi:predicted  nucleic acid-binding Zn-ribbon protein
MTAPMTRAASGGDGDLERRIAELERQLADMRSDRQYWNTKAEDQAALVEQLERQLAEARAALTSGEATLPKIV